MGRNKSDYKIHDTGTFNALNPDRYGAAKQGNDPWKRKRKERPDESAYNLPKLDVHGVLLLRKLRLQQAEMAALRTWAATAGAGYLPLQYDELRRDPVGVVSRIYAFLGVEAHETRPDLYARSMRKPHRDYVENLDEVREALRGTPWAADPVLT